MTHHVNPSVNRAKVFSFPIRWSELCLPLWSHRCSVRHVEAHASCVAAWVTCSCILLMSSGHDWAWSQMYHFCHNHTTQPDELAHPIPAYDGKVQSHSHSESHVNFKRYPEQDISAIRGMALLWNPRVLSPETPPSILVCHGECLLALPDLLATLDLLGQMDPVTGSSNQSLDAQQSQALSWSQKVTLL